MTIPVFRKFTIQDLPGAPAWVENLFYPLNTFGDGVINAFTQNLVIGDNVQGQKFSASFLTPSNYATGGFPPMVFSYTSGGQPTCLMIGSLLRNDGTLMLTPATITSWNLNINKSPMQVSVNYIAGLSASTNYSINLIAF